MQTSEAIRILRALAEGLDPYSGESHPQTSSYQHTSTVEALFTAIQALEHSSAKTKFEEEQMALKAEPWNRTGG